MSDLNLLVDFDINWKNCPSYRTFFFFFDNEVIELSYVYVIIYDYDFFEFCIRICLLDINLRRVFILYLFTDNCDISIL